MVNAHNERIYCSGSIFFVVAKMKPAEVLSKNSKRKNFQTFGFDHPAKLDLRITRDQLTRKL